MGTKTSKAIGPILERYNKCWVQPHQKTVVEVIDLFTLEQLTDLEEQMKKWVQCYQPRTMEEVLQLAEAFTAAEEETLWGRPVPGTDSVGPADTHWDTGN